jgi:putative endopeptidase
VAYQHVNGISNTLFGFSVDQDAKNVMRYIPRFSQGGTTLPDRDYYIKNDSRSTPVRNAYITHIQHSFKLTGADSNTVRYYSDAVMRIETSLAKSQFPRVDLRDPYKTYNILAVNDFSTMAPLTDWKTMLKNVPPCG